MASNIDNTCAVWNCMIIERDDKKEDKDDNGEAMKVKVMDEMGGLGHLRSCLPKNKRYELEGGKLYWITDRTPHEVLPMKKAGWRQFFRLVSHNLGVWYSDHSTKNPMGVEPDPKITKIVEGNKFDK